MNAESGEEAEEGSDEGAELPTFSGIDTEELDDQDEEPAVEIEPEFDGELLHVVQADV